MILCFRNRTNAGLLRFKVFKQKVRNESGQAMVEYGLVVTLLSATVFAVFPALSPLWRNNYGLETSLGQGRATLISTLGVNYYGSDGSGGGGAAVADADAGDADAADAGSVGTASTGSGPSGGSAASIGSASTGSGPSGGSAQSAGSAGSGASGASGGSGGSSF